MRSGSRPVAQFWASVPQVGHKSSLDVTKVSLRSRVLPYRVSEITVMRCITASRYLSYSLESQNCRGPGAQWTPCCCFQYMVNMMIWVIGTPRRGPPFWCPVWYHCVGPLCGPSVWAHPCLTSASIRVAEQQWNEHSAATTLGLPGSSSAGSSPGSLPGSSPGGSPRRAAA